MHFNKTRSELSHLPWVRAGMNPREISESDIPKCVELVLKEPFEKQPALFGSLCAALEYGTGQEERYCAGVVITVLAAKLVKEREDEVAGAGPGGRERYCSKCAANCPH